jgi:transposase
MYVQVYIPQYVQDDAQPPLFSVHLPRQVSRKDFNCYIAPYLTKPHKGPKPKVSLFKIFNYTLFVLHSGIPWRKLQTRGHELHWMNVYRRYYRWSKDGVYNTLMRASLLDLLNCGQLNGCHVLEKKSWFCVIMPPVGNARSEQSTGVRLTSRNRTTRDVWDRLKSFAEMNR